MGTEWSLGNQKGIGVIGFGRESESESKSELNLSLFGCERVPESIENGPRGVPKDGLGAARDRIDFLAARPDVAGEAFCDF